MTSRRRIPLKEKLASALREMLRPDETGKLVPIIPYDHAKLMSSDQIISLFHFDHGILHAHGGPDLHWNLTPRPIIEHRAKTSERDRPAADKTRRLSAGQEEFRRKVLTKPCGQKCKRESKIPPRINPWPKGRSFQKRVDQ